MHSTARGRSRPSSSSSASGWEALSEYAHGTTLQSRPSAAADPATARSASRSGELSTAHESTVTRRWPSSLRCRRLCWTPRSLSNTTSPAGATPGSASPMVTVGPCRAIKAHPPLAGPGNQAPPAARRAEGHDDESVPPLVDEALRELELPRGLAVGVGDEGA